MRSYGFCLWVLFHALGGWGIASERIESADARVFEKKVLELAQRHGAKEVLVAYDIDNTLLSQNQAIGSDQRFQWQEGLIDEGSKKDVVGSTFADLVMVQGKIFAWSHMHPTQSDVPEIVRALQEKGLASIVLTSRGTDFRDATERELKRNGYDLSATAIGPEQGYAGSYLANDDTKMRPISFQHGVLMGAGQPKGIMLLSLLKKTSRSFKAVAYIDDQVKHVERMEAAFKGEPVAVLTVRYGHDDEVVKSFARKGKVDVAQDWKILQAATGKVFN